MKRFLLELLICPACLPQEHPLHPRDLEAQQGDIVSGQLTCSTCSRSYPIRAGVAFLSPATQPDSRAPSKYETPAVLSSYLWSHYGDLLNDPEASDAYKEWAALVQPNRGLAIDVGAAVGRFSFELGQKCEGVIGIDNSHTFVRAARELLLAGQMQIDLAVEGRLSCKKSLRLPRHWSRERVDFIVGDALALPFRQSTFAVLASLNLLDKVPKPLKHLTELNRVAQPRHAQLLCSDPFSWSTEVAEERDWLGGTERGHYAGRGMDHLGALLQGRDQHLTPPWQIDRQGHVWWKIRTHANHFELIRSCYIKANRRSPAGD